MVVKVVGMAEVAEGLVFMVVAVEQVVEQQPVEALEEQQNLPLELIHMEH